MRNSCGNQRYYFKKNSIFAKTINKYVYGQ